MAEKKMLTLKVVVQTQNTELSLQGRFFLQTYESTKDRRILLYLLGPSSRQKVMVSMASSSKNSVVNASHQRLSQSWEWKNQAEARSQS